jgi:tmRNA-binding protein
VKVEVALCTGKKQHDKRDDLRDRTINMEMKQALKQANQRR